MWALIRKYWLGFGAILLILLMGLLALLGYAVSPDNTPYANQMHIQLATLPPGTEVHILHQKRSNQQPLPSWLHGMLHGFPAQSEELVVQNWIPHEGFLEVEDWGSGFVRRIDTNNIVKPSSDTWVEQSVFCFGTDRYGRDLLSRLIIASRISFIIGFIAVGISLLIGLPLGLMAGYFGGWVDRIVMWLVNVMWSIPGLLLVIALTLALGKGIFQVFIAIGLTMWVEVARIVRGQVRSLRQRSYVEVAQMMGFSSWRIIAGQILPGVLHPVIVVSAANFATAILLESGLSFLGYGAQPPLPTWGGMVKDHWPYLLMGKAHLVLWPGVCILILVLSFMILGNTLRDWTDPRSKNQ